MQNISADPMGEWLAGTDWSGLNYLWRVSQSRVKGSCPFVETSCKITLVESDENQPENVHFEYTLEEVNWNRDPRPLKPSGSFYFSKFLRFL